MNRPSLTTGNYRPGQRDSVWAWGLSLVATWAGGFTLGRVAEELPNSVSPSRWFVLFATMLVLGFVGGRVVSRRLAARARERLVEQERQAAKADAIAEPEQRARSLSELGERLLRPSRSELGLSWESLAQATQALLGILVQTLPDCKVALVRPEPGTKLVTCLTARPEHFSPATWTEALVQMAETTSRSPRQLVRLSAAIAAPAPAPQAVAAALWADDSTEVAQGEQQPWIHLLVEKIAAAPFSQGEKQLIGSLVEQLALSHRLETALKASHADLGRLAHLATTDGLTELANRRHFMSIFDLQIARAKRHERSLSLLFLDIDHFKEVNDMHGHPAGDDVLCDVAQLLCDTARRTDLVARYGGEEFAILMDETDIGGARRMAERIRVALQNRTLGAAGLAKTCSIGVAAFPDHGDTPLRLISAADTALYEAKRAGRDRIVVAQYKPNPST